MGMTAILAKPCPTCGALVPVVEEATEPLVPIDPKLDAVIAVVAAYYLTSRTQIVGPDRSRRIGYVRMMAMALCREQGATLERIGAAFNRHHSTVFAALEKFSAIKQDGAGDEAMELHDLRNRLARV